MSTIDGNGILFYEETDPVSPLHTLLNTGQQSVGDALDAISRVRVVATAAGPGSTTDYTGAAIATSVTVGVIAGHSYLVSAVVAGSKITNAGLARARFGGSSGTSIKNFATSRLNAGDEFGGSGSYVY